MRLGGNKIANNSLEHLSNSLSENVLGYESRVIHKFTEAKWHKADKKILYICRQIR